MPFATACDGQGSRGMGDYAEYEGLKDRWKGDPAGGTSGPLPVLYWRDIDGVQPTDRLVKRLIGNGSMVVLAGASGTGKTHLALDLALHVALGYDWFGQRVQKSGVLYVAAEGQFGLCNRIAAFRLRHNIEQDQPAPFGLIPTVLDLLETTDPKRLIEAIDVTRNRLGTPVGLVFIDTLARCSGGGDENGPKDMGQFIRNIDAIRERTDATVVIVHHFGKDQSRGMRGHNSLRGAADTVIEVSGLTNPRTFRVEKQKDGETGSTFTFRLEQLDLGLDEDGESITSCVVLQSDVGLDQPKTKASADSKAKLSQKVRIGLAALRDCIAREGVAGPISDHIPADVQGVTTQSWRKHLANAGIINPEGNDREQFRRISLALLEHKMIGVWEGFVWLVT
jgi:hypothetical protein